MMCDPPLPCLHEQLCEFYCRRGHRACAIPSHVRRLDPGIISSQPLRRLPGMWSQAALQWLFKTAAMHAKSHRLQLCLQDITGRGV